MILASASPQRRAILSALGVAFDAVATDVAEVEEGAPGVVARENALRKAVAASAGGEGELVLGVDTVVALDLKLWGKPPQLEAARDTLRALSGRVHAVVSGFAVVGPDGVIGGDETTLVEFRTLDDATVDWYLRSGEWEGRAGGYAIQGRGGALVRRIEGDYLNVVGLPLAAIIERCPDLLDFS